MSSSNVNVRQAENVSVLYTRKNNTNLEKINAIFIVPRSFYQNKLQDTAQPTTSGNKTVPPSISRSNTSSFSETCGLNQDTYEVVYF